MLKTNQNIWTSMIMLLLLCGSQTVLGQSTTPPVYQNTSQVARKPPTQVDDRNRQSELQNALQALRNETNSLRDQMGPNSTRPVRTKQSNQNPEQRTNNSQFPIEPPTDQASQIRKIEKRIQILRRMSAQKKLKKSSSQSPQTTPIKNVNSSKNVDPLKGAMDWQNQPPTDETTAPANQQIEVERVVEGIVDQFQLGNSLYAANEFDEALKAYDKVNPKRLSPDDELWLLYMTANCHRLLNNTETAESYYRNLAKGSQFEQVVKSARWWLTYLTEKKKNQDESENLNSEVDNLLKIAEAHVKQQ